MLIIFDIFAATLFVLSSGFFFNQRFRSNLAAVIIAGVIATVSSLLLITQIEIFVQSWIVRLLHNYSNVPAGAADRIAPTRSSNADSGQTETGKQNPDSQATSTLEPFTTDCHEPTPPPSIDGSIATEQQMKQGREDVVEFINDSDDFQRCVNSEFTSRRAAAKSEGKDLDPLPFQRTIDSNQRKKEVVGSEYNAAVSVYRAKHRP